MEFADFSLKEPLYQNIQNQGWLNPTHIQDLVIPAAIAGSDILGGAPTGTGKSAAFLIPIINALLKTPGHRGKMFALVLEPTRELCMQVKQAAEDLCKDTDIKVAAITGGQSREEQKNSSSEIVIATPGRLGEALKKEWLNPGSVEILVIDEADRMLDLGFFDEVVRICSKVRNRRQTMLFSATLEGRGVQDFADFVLNEPLVVRIGSGDEGDVKLPDLLRCRAYYADNAEKKIEVLVHLLTTAKTRALIFVRTKDRVQFVGARLKRAGFSCAMLQGDLGQSDRTASLNKFRTKACDLLVATDVAARGLDIPEVACVYNFDLPRGPVTFVHRAGRTARAGDKGVVVSFVEKNEIVLLEKIERYTKRQMERRQVKGLTGEFPEAVEIKTFSKNKLTKKSRAKAQEDLKNEKKNSRKDKKRHRIIKNKGKPDFAAKRAKKALMMDKKAQNEVKS